MASLHFRHYQFLCNQSITRFILLRAVRNFPSILRLPITSKLVRAVLSRPQIIISETVKILYCVFCLVKSVLFSLNPIQSISEIRPSMSGKSKNGFIQFCHYQKRVDPSLSSLSLPQLVERCSPLWESLSLAEKGSFKRSVQSSLSLPFCVKIFINLI